MIFVKLIEHRKAELGYIFFSWHKGHLPDVAVIRAQAQRQTAPSALVARV